MKKKIIALSLTMWYAFCPLLTTGCNQKENNSEIAKVWSALSTEKYMQSYEEGHTMLEKMGNTEAELDFVGMRGETQSMQLMITANEYIKGYNLTTADLQTQEGVKFDRANIQVYAEHYVEIYAPFVNQSKHGVPYYSDAGYYPDALVPIESYRITREDRVRAGNNQGIWIDVEIPYDTQAGDYSGVFILTLNDDTANPEIIEIPVTLKVYDLEMYEEVHSRTIFNIRYDQLSECLGDDYFDENTNQVYYDYLLSKRLCSGDINPDYTNNLTTFIDYISSDLAENPKVTTYTVPNELIPNFNKDKMCPKTYDPNNPTAEELEYQQKLQDGLETVLRKMLEKNILLRETGNSTIDILKKAMFYYEDEPTTGYRCERVRIFCSKLKLAKDAIVEEYAETFVKYPDLKESLLGIQEICPSVQIKYENRLEITNEELGNGLSLWCPEQYIWKDESVRDIIKTHMEAGEEFWWYTCVANSPIMSYYVESIPASMRMASWMQYDYNVKGMLYWNVVQWRSTDDPYKDIHYKDFGGGEGLLVYPGSKYGLKTPISSIRLEQLRAGQQDYEYFYMLQEYLTANDMPITAREIIADIGGNFYENAYFDVDISEKDFEEYRIKLLDILQDFANDDSTAASEKINKIIND